MSMLSGRKRPCLVLFQSFTTVDGQYGKTKTWVTQSTAWVNIEPVRGVERFVANEIESAVTHHVRGDYHDLIGITAKMRMVYSEAMDYGASPAEVPDSASVYEILATMIDHNERGDVLLKVEREGRNYGEIEG